MDRILAFRPHLRVDLAGDGQVFLVGELERVLLAEPLHARVARMVDGRRTEREIIAALEEEVSPPEVYYALRQLEAQGYLAEAVAGLSPEAAGYWSAVGLDAARATERFAATPVSVLATGGADREPLVEALAGAGIRVGRESAFWVVATGDYLDRELAALNRRARAEGARWMLIKPGGAVPWVGPMLGPGDGPCWACLAQRLRANRPVESFLARDAGRDELAAPPAIGTPATRGAALSIAALALARWIVEGHAAPARPRLLALDLARFEMNEHAVVRRPQCAVCGDPTLVAERARRPIQLASRRRRFSDDGGYRCATPEETYARHEHLISPLTGVVATVGPLVGRDHPLRPVYQAAYFQCPPADSALAGDEFARPSLGKGRTAAQARTGALCEAIERYSAAFQGDEAVVRARLAELGDAAVPPPALLHFSAAQYRRRDELNRGRRDGARLVPPPFDERIAIGWAPAWSLTHQRQRYLPASFCYLHAPEPPESRFCALDPNGHAAGNCLEEAILQGFLELAERDAVGIWWYGRVRRPAVDLASFDEPYLLALAEHYRALGYRLWVLDVTNDLDIPAFVAVASAVESRRHRVGFGCHLEARLGVLRALTELNQLFDPADRSAAPWGEAPLEDPDFLEPTDVARRRDDYPTVDTTCLGEDVRSCVARAARLGLETLVLDQTRPDIGLSAVKVVVPGLRHFWPRFGPGRLYDVPVHLGWLPRPRAEEELNPVPLYL